MGKFTPAPRLSAVAGSAPPLRGFLPWRDLHSAPRLSAVAGSAPPLRGFLPWRDLPPAPLLCGHPAWLLLLYWNVFVLSKNFAAFPSAARTALFTSFRIRFSPFARARGCGAENGAGRHRTGPRRPTLNGRRTNHTGTERAQNGNTARHRPPRRTSRPAANATRRCAFPCFPEKICI